MELNIVYKHMLLTRSFSNLFLEMDLKYLKSMSIPEKKVFLDSFDVVMTDCDGVLWRGSKVINKAAEAVNWLKSLKPVYFLTNSSTKTTAELYEKFTSLGFHVEKDEILGSAMLTAQYLKSNNFDKTVYLVGPTAVKSELDAVGIHSIGCGPDIMPKGVVNGNLDRHLDRTVEAVVVGFDVHFSYPKLKKATGYLTQLHNVDFLATNPDDKLPCIGGGFEPGSGSFIKAIESSSGRKASIIGKPSRFAFDFLCSKRKIDPKRVLMIGDRCDTDIQFGRNLEMQTLLVLTGLNKLDDVRDFKASGCKSLVPHYYTNSIGDLLEFT